MRVRKPSLPISSFGRERQKRRSSHFGLDFKGNSFSLLRELAKWLSQVSDPMVERVFLICKDTVSTMYTPVIIMIDAIREQGAQSNK